MLIFGTIVIYNQLNFIRNKDLGFDRHQVITIDNTHVLGDQAKTFRDELMKITGVKDATMSSYLPVNFNRSNDAFFLSPTMDPKTAISMQNWVVDEHYVPALNMQIIAGRNFSPQFPTDSMAIIVNEAAMKFLATKDILNKRLYNIQDVNTKALNEWHIIGVAKNFNFNSLRDVVTPLALKFGSSNGNISVRLNSSNVAGMIAQVKNKWQSMTPRQPFSYSFMDEDFNRLYTTDQRTGKIFISFAIFAILIASLGLFGLITYAAEQRVKEIGIRKVLGADVSNIVAMISKDFMRLVFIASLVAFPVAWWAMNKWLQDFAYRVNIGWWVFATAGIVAALIALITVSFQSVKAAMANPVESLRTE
jgi:putative ABC transport system permease protein